jgi:hypothetical protein
MLFMADILVTESDLIGSYKTSSMRHKNNALKYNEAINLGKKHGWNARKISKEINMPCGAVDHWLRNSGKPKSIKGVEQLSAMGLMPLRLANTPQFIQFIRILAFRYGDGCLCEQKRNNSYTFYACMKDLNDASKLCQDTYDNLKIKLEPHKGTNAYYVYFPASLARLMVILGVPVGDTTKQTYRVPDWIFTLPENIRWEFIDVLFSNEGSKPRLKPGASCCESNRLSLSSEESLALDFCNGFMLDIWKIISDLGVNASRPRVMWNQPRISKDGATSYPITIRILTKKENLIKFFSSVKYMYCQYKGKEASMVLGVLKNSLGENT